MPLPTILHILCGPLCLVHYIFGPCFIPVIRMCSKNLLKKKKGWRVKWCLPRAHESKSPGTGIFWASPPGQALRPVFYIHNLAFFYQKPCQVVISRPIFQMRKLIQLKTTLRRILKWVGEKHWTLGLVLQREVRKGLLFQWFNARPAPFGFPGAASPAKLIQGICATEELVLDPVSVPAGLVMTVLLF